jgi:superfamily II DNA helicase RecQ
MCAGFSLTIVPLLSLGADQEEKLTLRAKHAEGTITSVHLDEIRSAGDQELLISKLKLLPNESSTTVILFSSPQAMLNKKFLWLDFLNWLIDNNRLSMVCVDEVHLFAHFGMTFREEFKLLTPALFNKLKVGGSSTTTTTPLLFMTGACTKSVVNSMQRIIGITFEATKNVFWPAAEEMKHRQVFIEVAHTTQAFSSFKKRLAPRLKASTVEKFILCSNTRAAVERVAPKLCDWIDLEGYKSDALKIIGALHREQKFYHVRAFARSNCNNADAFAAGVDDDRPICLEKDRPFNPQILCATSGAANAGLDDPEVHGVTRFDFPPSVLDAQQEKGRAGRRLHANADSDWCLLCLSLESYVVLLKRLHDNPSGNRDSSYFETLENDMHDCRRTTRVGSD